MDFTSTIRRVLARKERRAAARRNARQDNRRRLVFEALESRQMLDAASLYETLPDVITIAETDQSYHYAIEGANLELVDSSSVDGLTASLPQGEQVAFTVMKTSTDGVVSTIGDVVVQLFSAEGEAPNSSAHFLDLVADDYYEGLSIHRIISGFMFQGGSPNGDGVGGSGLSIADEYSDVLTHSRRGVVAYANSGSGTSDAQFYVTFAAADYLDGSYNVFGYVVDGYDVLDELEAAEVTYNASGELSSPVDAYTLTNMRVVDEADETHGVLRLVADSSASGATELSVSSTNADGETSLQTTTVYVGDEGLQAYVEAALSEVDFNMTAGESITVELPTAYGGYSIQYTVTADSGASRYEIASTDDSYSTFTLSTEKSGAQKLTLTIKAEVSGQVFVESVAASSFNESDYEGNYAFSEYTSSGVAMVAVYKVVSASATTEQDVLIAPVAPTVSLSADSQATYGDVVYTASSLANGEVQFVVDLYRIDSTLTIDDGFLVALDGNQLTYTRVSHSYDEETGLDRYTISLNLTDEPSEGLHTLTIQDVLNVGSDSDALLSDATNFAFYYDPTAIAFVDAPTGITAYLGTSDSYTFVTNKTESDGSSRSDVAFSFVGEAPSFLTLSESGVLSWSELTSEESGSYTLNIRATDALGRTATETVAFVVSGSLTFNEFDDNLAETGSEYLGQVSANDATNDAAVFRYELVGDSNLSIDSSTGVLSWTIASDYLDDAVNNQVYSFAVRAVEQVEQEDGSYVDGASVEKTFSITVSNASFVADESTLPTWNDLGTRTATAGESVSIETVATAPTGVVSTEYAFTTDVPDGMTIDSDGVVSWSPSADYFGDSTTYSATLNVGISARSILAETDVSVDYTDFAETTLTLTLLNPNYVDEAPVFESASSFDAVAGETLTATIVATDPNGRADLIYYELVNDSIPDGMSIVARDGVLTWTIDSNYLDLNVRYQAYRLTIRATELYLDGTADNSYDEGLSSETTVVIYVDNPNYDETEAIVPAWSAIDAQSATAGETFELTVSATSDDAERIVYGLTGEYPDGMTISEDGTISWSVPEDYFSDSTTESKTISINLVASAIVISTNVSDDFSGTSQTSFELTVLNPNYEDVAPSFADVEIPDATTGEAFSLTVEATDPNGKASRIVYALDGEYPDGMTIDAETGVVAWDVPSDLLDSNVAYEAISIVVKATEQFLGDDGETYSDGLSSTKTFAIKVVNASYSDDEGEAPEWSEIPAQSATAGETFSTTVSATAPENAVGVLYELGDGAPQDMTIDPSTGAVSWSVPSDYFGSSDTTTASETIEVALTATTVLTSSDAATTYGKSASATMTITIANPNYVDPAPTLNDLESAIAQTGSTFETTISATDPTGDADRIVFSIENDALPEGLTLDGETGALTWTIASDYLAENVSAQVYRLSVKATKQTLNDDGTYSDGASASRTYEIMVANASASSGALVAPTIEAVADQTVAAGETLSFTVSASVASEAGSGVEYSFASDANVPDGMTIDATTGEVTYVVPSDYFDSLASGTVEDELTVSIQARTIVSSSDMATDYGGSATIAAKITVTNPNAAEYDDWQEWFDAWVDAARSRYDAHAENLSTYLSSYLDAVDARAKSFENAAALYKAGQISSTELIEARKTAQSTFEETTATARQTLRDADASADADYADSIASLNDAYDALASEGKTPSNAETLKNDAVTDARESAANSSTGNANFRLSNKSTGAKVATDLTSVLKMWRAGYSKATVYDEIYADLGEADVATEAPVFADAEMEEATTGETYSHTFQATDPDGAATRIVYELSGEAPDGMTLDAETGVLTWEISESYLASSVSSETLEISVVAKEQYLSVDGESYLDGQSTTKTFEIVVSNAAYSEDDAVKPTWATISTQTVEAGQAFELQVSATASGAESVEYAITSGAPSGMTISEDGQISWNSPEDYFADATTQSTALTIRLSATAVISSTDVATNYGDSASTSFILLVTNPNYVATDANESDDASDDPDLSPTGETTDDE